MSSYGLNAGMETPVPLNGIVNNSLLNTSPNINQTLQEICNKVIIKNSTKPQIRH